jgi:hypothetical protein
LSTLFFPVAGGVITIAIDVCPQTLRFHIPEIVHAFSDSQLQINGTFGDLRKNGDPIEIL